MPVLGHFYSKSFFPAVQEEPSVFQFVSIASSPVTGQHQKEIGLVFFRFILEIPIDFDEITPEPSLCSAKQTQLSQPFITGGMQTRIP